MSDPSKYPRFIWVVVAVILVAVIGYALVSRQSIQEIQFPGGGVKFGPATKDETVTFYVSYEGQRNLVLEGRAVLYLSGAEPLTLAVSRSKPFHTASVTVPKPGAYAYRLEQVELHQYQRDGQDASVQMAMRGEGKVDIRAGTAFNVTRVLNLESGGGRWFAELQEVRSEEEKRRIQEQADKELDRIITGK